MVLVLHILMLFLLGINIVMMIYLIQLSIFHRDKVLLIFNILSIIMLCIAGLIVLGGILNATVI